MRIALLFVFVASVCLADNPFQVQNPSESRTWTDMSGKFEVEGKLIARRGNDVILLRKDLRVVTIAVDQLSQADRDYLVELPQSFRAGDAVEIFWGNRWWRGSIKEVKDDQFFVTYDGWSSSSDEWVKQDRLRALNTIPSAAGTKSITQLQKADLSQIQTVQLPSERLASKYEPDQGTASEFVFRDVTLDGPAQSSWSLSSLQVNSQQQLAIIARIHALPNQPANTTLELCDLKRGKSLQATSIPERLDVLDISLDGQRVAIRSSELGIGAQSRIDVWEIEQNQLERSFSFHLYPGLTKHLQDVSWTKWIDDEHLLTLNRFGLLRCWSANESKAIWELDAQRISTPALSPSRQHVAIATSMGIGILASTTGKVLWWLPEESKQETILAVSNGGTQLAQAEEGRLRVWTFADHFTSNTISLPELDDVKRLDWVQDSHLLVNGQQLVSLRRQQIVWEYQYPTRLPISQVCNDQLLFMDVVNKRHVLTATSLLPAKVIEEEQQEPAFVIQPGMAVAFDNQVEVGAVNSWRIREGIKEQLTANGFEIQDEAKVKLVARIEKGPEQTRRYRTFGRLSEQEITFQPTHNILEFVVDGEVVWKHIKTASAPRFWTSREESIEEAIERMLLPNVDFFADAWIPSHVPEPLDLENRRTILKVSKKRA